MITMPDRNTFIITADGDHAEYIGTIKALIRIVATQNEDMVNVQDNYRILNLVESMLPSDEQCAEIFKSNKCALNSLQV